MYTLHKGQKGAADRQVTSEQISAYHALNPDL